MARAFGAAEPAPLRPRGVGAVPACAVARVVDDGHDRGPVGSNRDALRRTGIPQARQAGLMSTRQSHARAQVDLLEVASPAALELAVLVSLAVRIEPELLRAVRLSAAPQL